MSISDAEGTRLGSPGPLRALLSPIRWPLLAAALLAAAGTALTLVPLAGIAHVAAIAFRGVDGASAGMSAEIWKTVGVSVACAFAGMALVSAGELTSHLADNRITHSLRLAVAKRLAHVPLGWFTSRASGEVKQAMQDDIAALHSLTAHFFTAVGRALGAILAAYAYLFAVDWRMALVALLPSAGFLWFLRSAMKASGAHVEGFFARLVSINVAASAFVNGIPVLKAFGAAGKAHASYREAVDAFARAFSDFTRPLVGAMANAHALIAPVTMLGVVLAGGSAFVALGMLPPLDVLPFALVAPGVCGPLLLLHTLLHDLDPARGAAQRVAALLQTPVLESPGADALQLPAGPEIRFEHVSHAYEPGAPGVTDLDFTLVPGTVTAIVGASGAGKSTIARLLLRFFDPNAGRITLGGVDLRQIESAQLYRRIGFVLQEVRLIHASVRDNIALGRPEASQQEIEDAARAANIHERILALPRGYASVVGEDAQLSGGECQRVSIARAVLLDPPVLVLDEATASADAESDLAIQEALSRFARGRTLLVITHRLDTVVNADRILVLDAGAIVEQGTHGALLALNGRYARLWASGEHQRGVEAVAAKVGATSSASEAVPSC